MALSVPVEVQYAPGLPLDVYMYHSFITTIITARVVFVVVTLGGLTGGAVCGGSS